MGKVRANKGFTLMELMIVVAIIGIIAGIAYPAYMESVRKSNRADAKAGLNDAAQRLQRCYTIYNAYNNDNCGVYGELSGGNSIRTSESFYDIELSAVDATTYTLTATPVAGSMQAGDTKCTAFTLTHTGVRDANPGPDCW